MGDVEYLDNSTGKFIKVCNKCKNELHTSEDGTVSPCSYCN